MALPIKPGIKASRAVAEGTIEGVKDFAVKVYKDGAQVVEDILKAKPELQNDVGGLKAAIIQSKPALLSKPHSESKTLQATVAENAAKLKEAEPVVPSPKMSVPPGTQPQIFGPKPTTESFALPQSREEEGFVASNYKAPVSKPPAVEPAQPLAEGIQPEGGPQGMSTGKKAALGAAALGGTGALVAGSQTKSPGQASEGTGMSGGGEEEVSQTPKQKQKNATSEVQKAKASGKPATSGEAKVYQYSYNIETPEDIATSMKTAKSLADELSPSNKKEYELRLKVLEDEAKELKQLYKDKANIREWASIAEQFGTALAQLGAASYGLRNGINMSGLKFNLTDWDKKHQLALDEYKSDLEDVQGRRKDTLGQMDKEETRRQSLLEDLFKTQVSSSRQAASDKTEQNKAVADKKFQERENQKKREADLQERQLQLQAASTKETQEAASKLAAEKAKMTEEQKLALTQLTSILNNYDPKKPDPKLDETAAKAGIALPDLKAALKESDTSIIGSMSAEDKKAFVTKVLAGALTRPAPSDTAYSGKVIIQNGYRYTEQGEPLGPVK